MATQRDSAAGGKPGRAGWFDEASQTPRIEEYARQLDSFVQTMADGKVPQLDDALHEKVTRLLCELTAYDLMQTLSLMRPAVRKFRG